MTNYQMGSKINPFIFGENTRHAVTDYPLTRDDIGNQGRRLLTTFIEDRLLASAKSRHVSAEMLVEPGTPVGLKVNNETDVADALKQIGDQMDDDADLQKLIEKVPCDAPAEVLFDVSVQLFKDRNYNWGRVVALFYFTFKLVIKVLSEEVDNKLCLMRSIIEWSVSFIVKHVADWILAQGGWSNITEYLNSTMKQTCSVLLAGLLMTGAVAIKNTIVGVHN